MSPSVASSPGITSLPEPRIASRGSPAAQGPSSRQTTSRARQNSIQSISEVSKVRSIPTAPLSRQTSKAAATPDLGAISTPVRTGNSNKEEERNLVNDNQAAKPADDLSKSNSGESKTVYEANTIAIPEAEKKEPERPESSSAAFPGESKKEAKVEEVERKSESIPPLPTTMATVTTKSGRASKPSTPALQQFQEALGRPRSSRNNEGGGQSSKKHQKRNSTASQALAAKSIEESKKTASADDEDGDVDADELRYCYCNGVSYGGMVACDADGCEKEWFHLACVGLKVAPGSKSKSTIYKFLNHFPETRKKNLEANVEFVSTISNMVLRGLQEAFTDGREEGQRSLAVDQAAFLAHSETLIDGEIGSVA